jgi:hypothetical protein
MNGELCWRVSRKLQRLLGGAARSQRAHERKGTPAMKSPVVFGYRFEIPEAITKYRPDIRRNTIGSFSRSAAFAHPLCFRNAETRPENHTGRRKSKVVGSRFRFFRPPQPIVINVF